MEKEAEGGPFKKKELKLRSFLSDGAEFESLDDIWLFSIDIVSSSNIILLSISDSSRDFEASLLRSKTITLIPKDALRKSNMYPRFIRDRPALGKTNYWKPLN